MAKGMNKVILIGNLGKDPELRYTPSGVPVANFSLATSESWTNKDGTKHEETDWHNIVVWNKLAEICSQYLTKGKQVYIEGKIKTRSWDDQNGVKRYTTEVIAKDLLMLGGGGADRQASYTPPPPENPPPYFKEDSQTTEDDIPF